MAIKVMKPGLATTVQDLGRPGYYHLGIPISGGDGPLRAPRPPTCWSATTRAPPCWRPCSWAPSWSSPRTPSSRSTGAELAPKVNGEARETWTAFAVKNGPECSPSATLKAGARAYIAVSGGIDVPVVLGSRSTYGLGALGGHEGRTLKAGDELTLGAGTGPGRRTQRPREAAAWPRQAGRAARRAGPLLAPRHRGGAQALLRRHLEGGAGGRPHRLPLQGRARRLQFVERKQPFGAGSDPSNIVDACYPYGSIQVPGGTEPIVLHRDAVSGGGYFMVGTVISADMDLIGQLQPHTRDPVRVGDHAAGAAGQGRPPRPLGEAA